MDKHDVARVLGRVAAFLELQDANPFRVRAYHAAERAVTQFAGDLREALRTGVLAELRGIGPATLEIIQEVLETGRSTALEDLQDRIPPGLVEMMQLPGLGVAKIRQIHERLKIDTVPELEEAARDGRLAALPRFGAKTAENVLRAIAFERQAGGYRLLHYARAEATALTDVLRVLPGIRSVTVAGSVRRSCEIIRDLDFVVEVVGPPEALFERLARAPGVTESVRAGGRAATLRFQSGSVADIYAAASDTLGSALVRATGNDAHLRALAARAGSLGLAWRDDGLVRGTERIETPDEETFYRLLGMPWIAPELREGLDEVEAAASGHLPALVSRRDLEGFLHCHSNYSDGTSTVDDWARACSAAGYRYVGITDHSQTSSSAGGLGADDVTRQLEEIDAVNRRYAGIEILKGVEADILADGTLDYTPAIRARFDFIIASIHTRHGMGRAAMTRRVLTAMNDPTMTILGHPTGRLLLARDPFDLDLDRIFRAAADRGVAIEINADPQRLDLDWRTVRQAADAGVTISIGADAHGTSGLANVDLGIGMARKAWLSADDILNARSCDAFRAFAAARRS